KAARDWPGLDFVIYHAALRPFLETPDVALAEFEQTGRIKWATDLAEIPAKYGVTNVYAEIGSSLASSAGGQPPRAPPLHRPPPPPWRAPGGGGGRTPGGGGHRPGWLRPPPVADGAPAPPGPPGEQKKDPRLRAPRPRRGPRQERLLRGHRRPPLPDRDHGRP